MSELVTAPWRAAGVDARDAHPGFEPYDRGFAAALGPAPHAVSFTFGGPGGEVPFITTDTAIWAAVFNPAAGAGQRRDQEPGRW